MNEEQTSKLKLDIVFAFVPFTVIIVVVQKLLKTHKKMRTVAMCAICFHYCDK